MQETKAALRGQRFQVPAQALKQNPGNGANIVPGACRLPWNPFKTYKQNSETRSLLSIDVYANVNIW